MCTLDKVACALILMLLGAVLSFVFGFEVLSFILFSTFMISSLLTVIFVMIVIRK